MTTTTIITSVVCLVNYRCRHREPAQARGYTPFDNHPAGNGLDDAAVDTLGGGISLPHSSRLCSQRRLDGGAPARPLI